VEIKSIVRVIVGSQEIMPSAIEIDFTLIMYSSDRTAGLKNEGF